MTSAIAVKFLKLYTSDCNPGIGFSIPGSGIEKFIIPGSLFRN